MYRYGTGEAVVLKLSANSYRYGTGEPVVQTAQIFLCRTIPTGTQAMLAERRDRAASRREAVRRREMAARPSPQILTWFLTSNRLLIDRFHSANYR